MNAPALNAPARPLFASGTMRESEVTGEAVPRDLQVFPRTLRSRRLDGGSVDVQQLHRTAAIKRHLSSMAEREQMLSTTEHDYGFDVRLRDAPVTLHDTPRPIPSTPGAGARPVMGTSGLLILTPASLSGHHPGSATYKWTHQNVKETASTPATPRIDAGASSSTKRSSAGLQLTARGFDPQSLGSHFTAASHPHMVLGQTERQLHVQQAAALICDRAKPKFALPLSAR
eukprot:TRINITY_DN30708_c0_g1_i1.p1 TRINITY_DN30708_c0_g1~~TRINITY_DN30708_c0_g1_i1.p1  ORF type:complete len:229 (-),score=42.77 TRINITY_DN30708_c0_g1_i1:152-838(-)